MKKYPLIHSILASAIGLLTVPAMAADLPTPVAAVQAAPYDWSGPYVGIHGAYGGANVNGAYDTSDGFGGFISSLAGPFSLDPDGFGGGVQAGFNWQTGYFVYGIEGDITFIDWEDSLFNTDDELVSAETDFVATLRGRAGYAMDRVLVYGTAGIAWTDTEFHADDTFPSADSGTLDFDDVGVVAGGGVEVAVNQWLSIKAEGLYFWFDDDQDASTLTSDSDTDDFAELEDAWMVRIGANIHLASDRRLKRDITHIATLATGIRLYRFKYLWDDQVHVGVMAQDLLDGEVFRHAVVMTQNGYYAVNYETLGLKMATLAAWRDYGLAAVLLQSPGSRVSSLEENVLR